MTHPHRTAPLRCRKAPYRRVWWRCTKIFVAKWSGVLLVVPIVWMMTWTHGCLATSDPMDLSEMGFAQECSDMVESFTRTCELAIDAQEQSCQVKITELEDELEALDRRPTE